MKTLWGAWRLAGGLGLLAVLTLAACSSPEAPTPQPTPTPRPSLIIGEDSITIPDADVQISYDEAAQGTEQGTKDDPDAIVRRASFYEGDQLVFTTYDTDDNDCDELWFKFDEER